MAGYFGRCVAVEPNDDMRSAGMGVEEKRVKWKKGSAECTHEPASRYHLVTMASSFHWADFDPSMKEFHRVLKPGGYFVCLWNPRIIKGIELLERIESEVEKVAPREKRTSSGSSRFVENLASRLTASGLFRDCVYMESTHVVKMSRAHYLGVWASVNEIRAQTGEKVFGDLMRTIEKMTKGLSTIKCPYLTRAWAVSRD